MNLLILLRFVTAGHVVGASLPESHVFKYVSMNKNVHAGVVTTESMVNDNSKGAIISKFATDCAERCCQEHLNCRDARTKMADRDYAFVVCSEHHINTREFGLETEWQSMGHSIITMSDHISPLGNITSLISAAPLDNTYVFKNGATTHLTIGVVDRFLFYVPEKRVRIKVRKYEDWTFGRHGDSGSLVCDENGFLVGLLVQYYPTPHNFWIVIPMDEILQALDLSIYHTSTFQPSAC